MRPRAIWGVLLFEERIVVVLKAMDTGIEPSEFTSEIAHTLSLTVPSPDTDQQRSIDITFEELAEEWKNIVTDLPQYWTWGSKPWMPPFRG